jgi:integrase/recombinase XerD
MRYRTKLYVPFESWPKEDRKRWQAALRKGKQLFDDSGTAAHLAEASRVSFRDAYARLIAFLTNRHKGLLDRPPGERLNVRIVEEYIAWQPATTGPRTLANNLYWLGLMLRYMCPDRDWSWLLKISNRIAAQAKRRPAKHLLITSESLYLLGLQLMDTANPGEALRPITKAQALRYRDGLIIALLAAIPLRRRTLAALRIGHHLVRTGELWALDIPSELIKTKRPLAYSIPSELSQRIDVYLRVPRDRIPGARTHDAMWPSVSGGPMSCDRIYNIIRRHTRAALGAPVNPHAFRTAAGNLWSMHDPQNVRGVKDLLGHSNFNTTEKFYITAQSRVAGRTLARAANAMLPGAKSKWLT